MIEFEPTTAQQRMDLLIEVDSYLRDVLTEWANRWHAGPAEAPGEALRLRWQDDGTAVLEMEDRPVMRLMVGWEVGAVEYSEAGPRTDQARPMTWGTVPAGWYVQVPRTGEWFPVTRTCTPRPGVKEVTIDMSGEPFTHPRDPQGSVTACPGPPNATDAAIEALGFPEILEDGS